MKKFEKLKIKSKELRKLIFDVGVKNDGHLSTSLSCVEILVTLYFGGFVNHKKKQMKSLKRNTFVLSKGHAETIMYCILYLKNFISKNTLYKSYNSGKHILGGHVDHKVAGVELTTGSLGHGLGFSSGMALASKMKNIKNKHYVLIGDAECTEGSVWEAALFSSFQKLNNIIAIVDKNNIGSLDYVKNFTSLDPFTDKWKAFGWNAITVNGHDIKSIFNAIKRAHSSKKPVVIIAKTIKGKGLTVMENDPIWHTKKLNEKEKILKSKRDLGI
jgi:transketolase